MIRFLFILGCAILCATCQSPQPPKQLSPAFYYWQTTFNPGNVEKTRLQQLGIRKLYVRFFDVDWNMQARQPAPTAAIQFKQQPTGFQIIPVVFITNRTLQELAPASIPALARNIAQKINQISRQHGIQPVEIQLDCDWSGSTRERYFALLTELKKEFTVPLSATIRLHQIKYADRTGIPPVARGMLMFYNMADWKRLETRNSIYDLEVARRYTDYLENYSLPLDVVMPLFRWTVVYRNGRFLTLLNQVSQQELASRSFLKRQSDSTRFVAQRDTTAFGLSIRQNDLFRAEACPPTKLLAGKQLLLDKIRTEKLTFALYHLDSTLLTVYDNGFLKTLLRPTP
nr:hypothetical protein [Tellurirhabdus bombi]